MKKLAFILELEGGSKLISEISSVNLAYKKTANELKDVEKKLYDFTYGTDEQRKALEATGHSLDSLQAEYRKLTAEQSDLKATQSKLNGDLRDQQKLWDSVGKKVPTESLVGLRREYRELRKEIDAMDKAARASTEGLAKITKANNLKKEINEIGASVSDFREQVGSYTEALAQFFTQKGGGGGGALGSIIDPLSNLLGSGLTGGIGAGVAGGAIGGSIGALMSFLGPGGLLAGGGLALLTLAVDGVVDLTKEYEKLNSEVGTLLSLDGLDLGNATTQLKTISEVYGQEFEAILKAVQATNKAFGTDVAETINLIRLGLANGAELSGEFLDSAREYPRLIKEAGATQEEFIQLLILSTKEGIYSDKGIDVIKEGNIRIREQTKSTKDALTNAFGKSFTDNLLDSVNKGSITTFEAMKKISKQLTDVDVTASQTGAILADVFGGPGEDAGLEFIKLIQDVDGNLKELTNTTDAYYIRQNAQYEATLKLNQAEQDLAEQFAGAGTNLDILGTKAKTFALETVNDIVKAARVIKESFSTDGFFAGLSTIASGGDSLSALKAKAKLAAADNYAFRQLTEGEEKAAKDREERNKRGANGVAGLREEQQKLGQAIQDAKAKGEDYTKLLSDYNLVTTKLTTATSILSDKIKTTKDQLKDTGELGSINRIQKEISILQDKVNKSANPEQFLPDLETKKKQLKEAQDKIEESTEEGKKKAREQEIKDEKAKRELIAINTINDEKLLQATLSQIQLESDLVQLNEKLKAEKEGSKERLALEVEIAKKTKEIQGGREGLALINTEAVVGQITALSEKAARAISQSEEELQVRLSLVKLNSEKFEIERKLKNTKLTNEEILKLENELQEKLKTIGTTETQLSGINPGQDINNRESQAIIDLAGEVQTLEEFEKRKKEIVLNAELERLQLKKELASKNGENLLSIEQEIAEKQLEIQEETNAERLARDKAFQENMLNVQGELLNGLGTLFGEFIAGAEEDQKSFAKKSLILTLDTIDKIVNLYIAQIFAKQIAEKSFAGIATAAILSGVVKGLIGAAKSAINKKEEGGILQFERGTVLRDRVHSFTKDDLKKGAIFKGFSHASLGEHFKLGNEVNEAEYGESIINKRSTAYFKPLLSAINSFNGWGKRFETGAILGNTAPNLIPAQVLTPGGINTQDMEKFAAIVAKTQSDALTPIIDTIIDRVIAGLDTDLRWKNRLLGAQKGV